MEASMGCIVTDNRVPRTVNQDFKLNTKLHDLTAI